MTKYFKDTNGKPFQDATEKVIAQYGLVEIDKTEFDEIVVAINTPTEAELLAQEVAEKKAYLESTDHKMLNGYVLKDGEDLDAIIVVRNEAREFIRANEV